MWFFRSHSEINVLFRIACVSIFLVLAVYFFLNRRDGVCGKIDKMSSRGWTALAIGAFCNALVICVNGLRMPIRVMAENAGTIPDRFPLAQNIVLPLFGDIIALDLGPKIIVFSFGDIFCVFGTLTLIAAAIMEELYFRKLRKSKPL